MFIFLCDFNSKKCFYLSDTQEPTLVSITKMDQIPQPLSESQLSELDTEKFVVIIANDNTTKFACSRNSLHRFSKLYRALSQSSSEVDELPLRCAAATPETTALVCMWMNHYDVTLAAASSSSSPVSHSPLMNQNQQNTTKQQQNSSAVTNPSRVSYPLQPGNSLSCFPEITRSYKNHMRVVI